MAIETTLTGPLSAGQWEALIFGTPDALRPLVLQLAIHHGAMERPTSAECPVCGKPGPGQTGGQMLIELEEPCRRIV